MARQSLRLAFFLTLIILLASCVGGLLSHSLALLSDAGHTLTDIFALGLAWFASSQAERPSNERKTFGYHRVGILAALINGSTLIVIALVIAWEAIQRFHQPVAVNPLIMFLSAAIAIAVNLFIGFGLRKEDHNLNVRAAALHVFGDVGASAAVIVAGVLILLTGWTILDPILSMGIALFIAVGAWRIVRETTDILLEAVPREISLQALVSDMKDVEGVKDVHDLHVWCITSGMTALSSHVLIDNLPASDSDIILRELNEMLQEKYTIGHATIQFEYYKRERVCCESGELYCHLASTASAHSDHDHATHAR
jgi:cobalt-zinc-cadmium efflux system protein